MDYSSHAGTQDADDRSVIRRPAEAGTQGRPLNRQLIIKVPPLRIMTLNQFELPRAPPLLEPLFAQDGGLHGVMKLGKDQPMDPVVLDKAGNRIRPMLVNPEHQVAGHADIKRPIPSARKDVDAWALLDHVKCRGPGSPLSRGRR